MEISMSEKVQIPQHNHCRTCGKAFIGTERYCSDVCASKNKDEIKKKKKELYVLFGVLMVIMIIAIVAGMVI